MDAKDNHQPECEGKRGRCKLDKERPWNGDGCTIGDLTEGLKQVTMRGTIRPRCHSMQEDKIHKPTDPSKPIHVKLTDWSGSRPKPVVDQVAEEAYQTHCQLLWQDLGLATCSGLTHTWGCGGRVSKFPDQGTWHGSTFPVIMAELELKMRGPRLIWGWSSMPSLRVRSECTWHEQEANRCLKWTKFIMAIGSIWRLSNLWDII